jgi:hypothetical protein
MYLKMNRLLCSVLLFSLALYGVPPVFAAGSGGPNEPKSEPGKYEPKRYEPKRYDLEERAIPKTPSAPPVLLERVPPEIPHCERYVTYKGKTYECDSQLGLDAEKLRPIVQDVPAALAELDSYQKTQRNVRIAAYVGSLGLASLITGAVISRPMVDPTTGSLKAGGYLSIAGIFLMANAVIYGLSIAEANKAHLGKAVDAYNAARPDDPIQPQFDTRVHF